MGVDEIHKIVLVMKVFVFVIKRRQVEKISTHKGQRKKKQLTTPKTNEMEEKQTKWVFHESPWKRMLQGESCQQSQKQVLQVTQKILGL